MNVAWFEHHGTRIVSLAGFAGGAVAMTTGEFPLLGAAIGPIEGALIAGASAALHLANRALDAFAESAGVQLHAPLDPVKPSE